MTPEEQAREFLRTVHERVAKVGRFGHALAWMGWIAMAGGMALLAGKVGPMELLEAPLARGLSMHLVLSSVPFAFGVATMLGRERAELETYAARMGIGARLARNVLLREAIQRGAVRVALPAVLLAVLAAALSPSVLVAVSRLSVGALFAALGGLATSLLVVSAAGLARASRWPRLWLFAALVLPPILVSATGLPRWVSPTGAYGAARDFLLDRAERSAERARS